MGSPFQKGLIVKKVTIVVIKNNKQKRKVFSFSEKLFLVKVINIIPSPKYQNAPCPIWAEPVSDNIGLELKKLEIILINPINNGNKLIGLKIFIIFFLKNATIIKL